MNIYEQLASIAKNATIASEGNRYEFFTTYQDDLHVLDRDDLENDSQSGDTYLWVLKSNGCGTYLFRLDGRKSDMLSCIDDASMFYLIKCTDINEGSVHAISRDLAERAHLDYPPKPNRIPRRERLYDQLNNMLGIHDKGDVIRLQSTLMGSEFNPMPDDKAIIKLSLKSRTVGGTVQIDVLRTKMNTEKSNVRIRKSSAHYMTSATIKAVDMLSEGPKYYLIDSGRVGFATITETTESVFKAAQRKIDALSKGKNPSLGMSC